MYKNIISSLVSMETNLDKITGFNLCPDFNFYPSPKNKNKFHYKIILTDDIEIPATYDFRDGFFTKKGIYWYYEKRLSPFTFKFSFDTSNKIFSFNKSCSLIPFEIGHIFPVGRHIADLINLELFLAGYVVFNGLAVNFKKNICIVAPGYNGKTEFVRSAVLQGGKYIAEDNLVLNFMENKVYPTAPHCHGYERNINQALNKLLSPQNIIKESSPIGSLYLIENFTADPTVSNQQVRKNLFNYLNFLSLNFLRNHFVRAYIFEENLTQRLYGMIKEIQNTKFDYKFAYLKNFDFNGLLKNTYENGK